MTINERIKKRRLEIGMTVEELAKAIGKNRATVYRYENTDIENLPVSILEPIAKALRTTPAELMGWDGGRTVPPELAGIKNIHPLPKSRRFPVIGAIACGKPIEAVEEYAETLDFPDEIDADVLLRCRGDSMTPAYHDGDYVFIRRQPTVENGQIAAVYVKDGAEWDATLKKVIMYPEKNMIVLRPLNADYEDMIFTGEECEELEIFGVAVAIYRKV